MSKSATLTFGMDLSDFSSAMKAINKQASSFSDQISKATQWAMQAYKKGLSEIAKNPLNLTRNDEIRARLNSLSEDIKKATTHKLNLDIKQAKDNISGLKEEIIATVGSMAILSKPISSAIDFESAMADVKKVVDFTGDDDVKNFSNQIIGLSRTIPLSVNELAQITASGGQLGIKKENLMDFTQTAAKMGVAFDMSAKDAGDNMATLMNIFGMGVKEVGDLGDTINHISNKSASTANKIVNTVGRIAGNAKDFGLSADATAGLASSFISLGKTPEVAATAINSMLTVLNNADTASGDVAESFQKIGVDGKDLKNAIMKDPQKALTQFLHTLSKIPKAQKTGILTSIFGKNFGDDISLVTGAIENFDKAMMLSGDKNKAGSMESEFKSRSETTANNIQQMKNAFNEISINVGSVFLPILNKVIDAIRWVSYGISGFAQTFPGLIKLTFGAAAALTTLKAAFLLKQIAVNGAVLMGGEFRKVLMKLPIDCLRAGGALNTCSLGFKNFGLSMVGARLQASLFLKSLRLAMFANPIGLIALAISAAAILIYKFWQPIKAFFSGIWQGIKEGLSPIASSISEAFAPLKPIFTFISGFFSSIFSQSEATKESLAGFESVGHAVGKAIGAIIDIVTTPLQWIIGMIKWVFDFIAGSKAGQWLGEKMGLNLTEADRAELKAMSSSQTTAGSLDKVMADKQIQNAQNSTKQINDNKKIDIHMHGTNATPQAVAVAVADTGYSFGD